MATSQELLAANIKPCAIFKELLTLSVEDAIVRYGEWKGKDKVKEKIDWAGTVWELVFFSESRTITMV